MADQEAHSCFWNRGLIPAAWTAVPPPAGEECWRGGNLLTAEAGPGCLGHGTADRPVRVYGDASGGRDTHDPRL
eukprot:1210672-Pyramimonas_sp.AAC.1